MHRLIKIISQVIPGQLPILQAIDSMLEKNPRKFNEENFIMSPLQTG
jgi:hypothetical protein